MNWFNKFVPNDKSRAKITIGCLLANYLIATYALHKGANMTELGAGLSMLNAPLYVYILGESIRPSKVNSNEIK